MSTPPDNDILGQADALLRRHSGIGTDTGAVPVLTDLVDAPVEAGAPAAAELAREVFDRVIAEVEGRLKHDLEERLVPQVHAAVASALGDLHQELANAIGDAVTEALKARQVK